jgi:HPt (histidine-containing phosphotransfer) domain-containing protein
MLGRQAIMWNGQTSGAIDTESLELLVEMIGADEPAAILDLFDTYIGDSAKQIEELQHSFAAGDFKTTYRLAHSMKSSSATFGALTLSQYCESLEHSARGECADGECAQQLDSIVVEHARVIEALTQLRLRFIGA